MKRFFLIILFILFSCSQAQAIVEFVAVSSAVVDGNEEIVCDKPTGTIDDDVMVAHCFSSYGLFNVASSFSAPSGWVEVFTRNETGGTDRCTAVFYKVADSEGSDYTFTPDVYAYSSVSISTFRGVDTTDVLDVIWNLSNHFDTYLNDLSPASPSITTEKNGSMIMIGMGHSEDDTTNSVTPPSGYTERLDANGSTYIYSTQAIATKSISTAGSNSPGDWVGTGWNVNTDTSCWIISLKALNEPYFGPWTEQIDLKIDIESYVPSIRGLGNNLIWRDHFDVDLTNWTDLSIGTATVAVNEYDVVMLTANMTDYAAFERSFEVESTDDWIVEFDLSYGEGDQGSVEILNSDNDQLVLFEFGTTADTVSLSTDLETIPSTKSFPDSSGNGKQCIISYNHSTESICAFISGAAADLYVLGQIGSAKTITPATSLKLRFKSYDGISATNFVYVLGNCKVYHPQMLVLGGSLTQGLYLWCNPPEYWLGRVGDYDQAPFYQLSRMYSKCEIGNRAFGGSSAQDAIDDSVLTNLLKEKPTHVYISYDYNGMITNGGTLSTTQTNLTSMINQVHNAGITGKNLIIGNCVGSSANEKISGENSWLEEIQATQGFLLLDLAAIWRNPSDTTEINPSYDSGDNLHFNLLGYTTMAEELYDLLENPYSWWHPLLVW